MIRPDRKAVYTGLTGAGQLFPLALSEGALRLLDVDGGLLSTSALPGVAE